MFSFRENVSEEGLCGLLVAQFLFSQSDRWPPEEPSVTECHATSCIPCALVKGTQLTPKSSFCRDLRHKCWPGAVLTSSSDVISFYPPENPGQRGSHAEREGFASHDGRLQLLHKVCTDTATGPGVTSLTGSVARLAEAAFSACALVRLSPFALAAPTKTSRSSKRSSKRN